jgi:hypothetical protein
MTYATGLASVGEIPMGESRAFRSCTSSTKQGVIRFKWSGAPGKEPDKAIEQLLAEMKGAPIEGPAQPIAHGK